MLNLFHHSNNICYRVADVVVAIDWWVVTVFADVASVWTNDEMYVFHVDVNRVGQDFQKIKLEQINMKNNKTYLDSD